MIIHYVIFSICFGFSAYGKSNITNLIRNVLHTISTASGENMNMCLDEFIRAGLMNCLDKCTKIFMTDEADMAFVDAGLFNCFAKRSTEANYRIMIL
ncbi:unnamed protein product [Rotaria sp. Silwood1]|nr:unnamed protein product [Rotaria sp. Silwood1]